MEVEQKMELEAKKAAAATALREVPPGPLGTELFDAVASHSISFAFEAAALRRGADGKLYIYLCQRAQDDTAYPGQWHIPGSIRRPREKWDDVMIRLSWKEFEEARISNRHFVGNVTSDEVRGHIISSLYLVDVGPNADEAKWFPVDAMPGPLVDIHEKKLIPLAIAAFEVCEASQKLSSAAEKLSSLAAQFCES